MTDQMGADAGVDDSSVTTLTEAIDLQIRRLRNIATGDPISPQFLLGELYGTVLPLLRDVLPYIERNEEHAAWASETLEHLSMIVSGGEDSSQLSPADAEKIKAFLLAIEREATADLERFGPTGVRADADDYGRADARLRAVREVVALVDEITIEPEDPDDDDAEESEPDVSEPQNGAGDPEALRTEE